MMKQLVTRTVLAVLAAMAASAAWARDIVTMTDPVPPGVIVIHSTERALYLTLGAGQAIRYPIAVGRIGKQWTGTTYVANKVMFPTWQPPEVVRHDIPTLPQLVPPGPKNPLGTRALVLARDEYAIHGTNAPESIGHFASYGCIRMHNIDVEDLFQRIAVGTPVVVTK